MAFERNASVFALSGVGKEREKKLERLGIRTLDDLLYYFPRAYENRGDIRLIRDAVPDEISAFLLTVATEVSSVTVKRGITLSKFRAFDDSGALEVVFFNSPFVKQIFHVGSVFRFYGKLTVIKGRYQLVSPKYEPYLSLSPLADFVPVYSLTEGITSKLLAKLIREAQDALLPTYPDFLPEELRLRQGLPTLSYAIENTHFPKDEDALVRSIRRLAFDEMLLFALGISKSAKDIRTSAAPRMAPCSVKPFLDLLPYTLTNAQKNAVNEIYRDLTLSENGITPPMTRILVGDVGSGKTVCAALSVYIVLKSGYQSALMAPTEILARQHYTELSKQFSALGFRVALLLGSTKAKEKNEIYKQVASGEIQLLIGTHAILSDKVSFQKLGLVITDEQHRFGVMQRAALKNKSDGTHLLVMSATPIPRTLALSMYGDLNVSRIHEMPAGRQRVDTFTVDESYRDRLNAFIKKLTDEGGQCYIVCPSIEPGEESDALYIPEKLGDGRLIDSRSLNLKNTAEYTEQLRRALPSVRIECLHGKMNAKDKDDVMNRFVEGEIDCIVSTTVIEVGINVPNACLMIVENAERFGLSQLHQLRGRVGRGKRKSYCILVSDHKEGKAHERLQTMCKIYDGYEIAEKDLLLRGPGDFFANQADSFRQSGGFTFRFAKLCDDTELFHDAFREARELIDNDPALSMEEHLELKNKLGTATENHSATIS